MSSRWSITSAHAPVFQSQYLTCLVAKLGGVFKYSCQPSRFSFSSSGWPFRRPCSLKAAAAAFDASNTAPEVLFSELGLLAGDSSRQRSAGSVSAFGGGDLADGGPRLLYGVGHKAESGVPSVLSLLMGEVGLVVRLHGLVWGGDASRRLTGSRLCSSCGRGQSSFPTRVAGTFLFRPSSEGRGTPLRPVMM